jgi:hypothetical protein
LWLGSTEVIQFDQRAKLNAVSAINRKAAQVDRALSRDGKVVNEVECKVMNGQCGAVPFSISLHLPLPRT